MSIAIGCINRKLSDFGHATNFWVNGSKIRGTRKALEMIQELKKRKEFERIGIYENDTFLILSKPDKTGLGIISNY